MIQALNEVLKELTEFALGRTTTPASSAATERTRSSVSSDQTLIDTYHDHLRHVAARTDTQSTGTLPREMTPAAPPAPLRSRNDAAHRAGPEFNYVAKNDVLCYQRPVRALDSVIGSVPYGTRVTVREYQGRWARIERAGASAWVEKDTLREDREEVFPHLEPGIVYDAVHPVTEQIRMLLQDEFAARDLLLPLLDIEYVTYRLYMEDRVIPWPPARPRLSGRWSGILKGIKGVHIGIRPGTHAIMEWVSEEGDGHVAYVESVRPDEAIDIAGILGPVDGRFDRQRLDRERWQRLGPTFIELT